MDLYVPLFLILPLLLGKKSTSIGTNSTTSEYNFPDVDKFKNVPFAMGAIKPKWPVITKHSRGREVPYRKLDGKYIGNAARTFGAMRGDGVRRHVGIDLYCNAGDLVVASESGIVVGTQGFLDDTKAILIQGNSGLVQLYGEVANNSWNEFNIKKGSIVKAGSPIARIGINDAATFMLHFETYSKGTTKNYQWKANTSPVSNIKNPTKYLLQAQKYDLS